MITPLDLRRLRSLAAVLLPESGEMPGIGRLEGFDALLQRAVKACGYPEETLRQALDRLADAIDWESARALKRERPQHFDPLSVLVSAAYYMAPEVLAKLKFPTDRRHPAGVEEFLEEYETGILDPVIERGPRFRPTR